jgi:hypothetical protein
MFVEGIGDSTRIGRYYYFTRRYHIDFLIGGTYQQRNIRDTEVASLRQNDLPFLPSSEPVGGDRQRVGTRVDGWEIEDPGAVRCGVAFALGGFVRQHYRSLGNNGAA